MLNFVRLKYRFFFVCAEVALASIMLTQNVFLFSMTPLIYPKKNKFKVFENQRLESPPKVALW